MNAFSANQNANVANYNTINNSNLQAYNTNYANTLGQYTLGYQQQQQQQNNLLTYLQNLTGSGQNAAAGLASANQSYANNAGNSIMQGGNAQASGIVGSANAISGGLSGALNSLGAYSIANPNASTNGSNLLSSLGGLLGIGGNSQAGDLSNYATNASQYTMAPGFSFGSDQMLSG